jgi:hypothetical protein
MSDVSNRDTQIQSVVVLGLLRMRFGMAWRGLARWGPVWRGLIWCGVDAAGHGTARLGDARPGTARRGMVWCGCGEARGARCGADAARRGPV